MVEIPRETKTALLRISDRLYDGGAAKHGTLPGLLVLATIATGAVDGVSYLGLHHIFVANMTGNVVFFGFALAGAQGLTCGPRRWRSARSSSARAWSPCSPSRSRAYPPRGSSAPWACTRSSSPWR